MDRGKWASGRFTHVSEEPPKIEEAEDYQLISSSVQRHVRILVVDEKYLTDTLSTILEESGYRVDAVVSGAQALRMVTARHYDLVVMEARLPDAKGVEVAQVIRSMSRDTRIILMTRDEYWRETVLGAPTEVDAVLLKPFPPEKLIWAAKMVLPKVSIQLTSEMKLPFG